MQKLNEIIFQKPMLEDTPKETLPDGVLSRVTYNICNLDERNANRRIYGKDVWEKVLATPDILEKLKNRALFGQAEHPEQTQSDLQLTSHVIFEMWIDEDESKVFQKIDVLDTPTGRIIDTLLRAGCNVGVSTRAEGDLEEGEDDEGSYSRVIADSYNFKTTDFTADPSTFGIIPLDVKRNVIAEIKRSLNVNGLQKKETKFANLILESIQCNDSECIIDGAKKLAKEAKIQEAKEEIDIGDTIQIMDKEGNTTPVPKAIVRDKDEALSSDGDMYPTYEITGSEDEDEQEWYSEEEYQIILLEKANESKVDEGEKAVLQKGDSFIKVYVDTEGNLSARGDPLSYRTADQALNDGWDLETESEEDEPKKAILIKNNNSTIRVLVDTEGNLSSRGDPLYYKTVDQALDAGWKLLNMENEPATKVEESEKEKEEEVSEEKVEDKLSETADIHAMYKAAGLPAPDGKGIHTKAFHELAIDIAKGYVKKGDTGKKALDKAYPTAMKQLGKKKAVKKAHRSNEAKVKAKMNEKHVDDISKLSNDDLLDYLDYWERAEISGDPLNVDYARAEQQRAQKEMKDRGFRQPVESKTNEGFKEVEKREVYVVDEGKPYNVWGIYLCNYFKDGSTVSSQMSWSKSKYSALDRAKKLAWDLTATFKGMQEKHPGEFLESQFESLDNRVDESTKVEVIELLKQGKVVYGVVKDANGEGYLVGKIDDLKEYEENGYWNIVGNYSTEEEAIVEAEKLSKEENSTYIGVQESKANEKGEIIKVSKEDISKELYDKSFAELSDKEKDEVNKKWTARLMGRESISSAAKEITDLKIKEASTRAERDKAIEILKEFEIVENQLKQQGSVKALEARILLTKLREINIGNEKVVSALRRKLEEKATLAKELFEKIKEIEVNYNKDFNEVKESIAVTEEKHQTELNEVKESTTVAEEKHQTELNEVKSIAVENTKNDFIKQFIELRLVESGLSADQNSQALLEECDSFERVDEVIDEIRNAKRRGALHSKHIEGINIVTPFNPEEHKLDKCIGSIFKGFGYKE